MPEFDDALDLLPVGPDLDEDGLSIEEDPAAAVLLEDAEAPPLGRSELFDMGEERFIQHGRRPQQIAGTATLLQWIDKYLHTERGALPIHPDWFGMSDPYAMFSQPVQELSAAELLEDMQGMTNHPNIAEVVDARLTVNPLDEAAYLEVDVLTDPPTEDVEMLRAQVRVA